MPIRVNDPAQIAESDERLNMRAVLMARMLPEGHAAVTLARAGAAQRRLERAKTRGASAEAIDKLEAAAKRLESAAQRSERFAAISRRREEVFLQPNPKVSAYGRVEDARGRALQGVPVEIHVGAKTLIASKTGADGTFAIYAPVHAARNDQTTEANLRAHYVLQVGAGIHKIQVELKNVGTRVNQCAGIFRLAAQRAGATLSENTRIVVATNANNT